MAPQRKYCLLACTPMSGLGNEGIQISGQLACPNGTKQLEIRNKVSSPLAAIVRLLNELGSNGWELAAFDTTTNRGVFGRAAA